MDLAVCVCVCVYLCPSHGIIYFSAPIKATSTQLPATDENREMDLNAAPVNEGIKEIFVEFFAARKGHMF